MTAVVRSPRRLAPRAWIVLILLLAAALRLAALSEAPPGMTHDEADHGLTAWSIVNGARALYFPIGYGREPLYDYATAVVMRATGPTLLAARLTAVYFGLLLIAATYAWTRRAFGAPVALLTAAGLAAGFWPLMTARQALRSIALPALFALAVAVFWRAMAARRPSLPLFALAGALLGLTFYTYIPARIMWPALPLLAGYEWARRGGRRAGAGRAWRGPLLTLLVAAAVAAPLLLYLAGHPALEVRVGELSAPLRAAAAGDLAPLLANATASLRLFTIEGDQTWRYNIPGRPFLPGPLGWLFYAGLLVAGWQAVAGLRRGAARSGPPGAAAGAFLALVWLLLAFAPVLVTGPGLSTTQAIGAQPVVYLFPALALVAGYGLLAGRGLMGGRRPAAAVALAIVLYAAVGLVTARAYFGQWANHPEVRVQYETAMVTALRALDARGGAAAVSTITPGPYHTPAVALLTLRNPTVAPRWFDGRQSLLLPAAATSTLVVPGFTPLPPALQPYLATATLVDELPMRPDDLDRPVRLYSLDGPAATAAARQRMETVNDSPRFGEAVELLGYELSTTTARPGETVTLVTAWRLRQPLPGAALFAHLLGPAGPLAQSDSLGAPGESWVAGDTLLQVHTLPLPADIAPGAYPLAVGVYTRPDGARLPLAGGGDMRTLTTLTVVAPEGDG